MKKKCLNVDKDATFCTHTSDLFFCVNITLPSDLFTRLFLSVYILGVYMGEYKGEEKVCLLNAINKNALSKHFSHLRCNLIECDKIVSREKKSSASIVFSHLN